MLFLKRVIQQSNMNINIDHRHRIQDLRVAHTLNNKRVWSRKSKQRERWREIEDQEDVIQAQVGDDTEHAILIGSITVTLGSSKSLEERDTIDSVAECPLQKLDNGHKKSANSNTIFTVTQIIQLSCKETITSDGHVKLTIGNNIMNQVLGSYVPK